MKSSEGRHSKRVKGGEIFQGEIRFPRFLLFAKPAKGHNRFPLLSPKDGAVAKGDGRRFEHTGTRTHPHTHTQSSAFCSRTSRFLRKHNCFLSVRRNKNPYYYNSCVIAKLYQNTTTDIKYLTPLNCLFHGL